MKNSLEEVTGIKLQKSPRQAVLKADGHLEVIEYNDQIVEFVNCNECNSQHLVHEESYLELAGNLHVGGEGRGGLLGNGDWKNIGVPVYYFCINNRCLSTYIRRVELKELTSMEQIAKVQMLTVFEVGVPVYINSQYFLKPYNKYCVVAIGSNKEEAIIEGMIHSMKLQGEYAEHRRANILVSQIQEWMAQGIVQIVSEEVIYRNTDILPITIT